MLMNEGRGLVKGGEAGLCARKGALATGLWAACRPGVPA